MQKIIIACLMIVFSLTAYAQEPAQHYATANSPDSRFEIVQSSLAAKNTFRLDRISGDVWVLTAKSDGDFAWDRITRMPHKEDRMRPDKVNYQMFLSGLAVRYTFLINVNTGATWFLTRDTKTDSLFLDPMN